MSERLAIPKKGRVYEQVFQLMSDAGLKLKRKPRLDFCVCEALGIEVYFLPAKDIPNAVESGAIHYGVTGIDLIKDSRSDIDTHLSLGIGQAKMVVATPETHEYQGVSSLNGKTVGSSYIHIAEDYLKANKVKDYKLVHFAGAVEIQVALGVADAIVEITETGSSLAANRLKIRDSILTSEMVLISTKGYRDPSLELLIKRLERVLKGRSHVLLKFNLPKEQIDQACALSKGISSPTVNELADPKWVALEMAVPKKDMHELMDSLIEIGGKGILAHEMALCSPD